jgi:hypothetical protein
MVASRQVRVFFLLSCELGRGRIRLVRRLWGDRFERGHCTINPDRHQPVPSIPVHGHPHAVDSRVRGGVVEIFRNIAYVPAPFARQSCPDRAGKALAKWTQFVRWGSLQRLR